MDANLHYVYSFWTFFKRDAKEKSLNEFQNELQKVVDVLSLDEFWGIYKHLKRPSSLDKNNEIMLFRNNIKPYWEDSKNKGGGRVIIPLKKDAYANKLWEELLVLFIHNPKEIRKVTGVVLNAKSTESLISVWTKALAPNAKTEIRDYFVNALNIPGDIKVTYKDHPVTKPNVNK